jgi:hypothetical protein
MSKFQVTLNNSAQGLLDINPTTSVPYSELIPSLQRTLYVAGPNRKYRKLKDGDIFYDCNYWKQFSYPNATYETAFITVLEDDGSIYSDVADENVFPSVYTLNVAHGSSFSSNVVDIFGDTGSYAAFVQITNQGMTPVQVRLNGLNTAVFDLQDGETQVFNNGDLPVTKLEFSNTISGGSDTMIQVIASVRSVCKS